MLYHNSICCVFNRVKRSLRRGLLYPFNYGSVLFSFRRRFSFYYIIRIKSNFLSRFISFCQNISHSCRNKRCAVTAVYGKRRNLFRTVARLKKSAAGFRPAAPFCGAGNENRTRNRSLGSSYFTTKLCPQQSAYLLSYETGKKSSFF